MSQKNLLTYGTPYKKIIAFAIPIMLGSLANQLFVITDSLMISLLLSETAFAGVASTVALSFLVVGFAHGLTAGCSILVAQSFGAKDPEMIRKNFYHNLLICLLISLFLTMVSLLLLEPILRLVNTPDEIWDYAYTYLFFIFLGITSSVLLNFCYNILRALGDSKTPLYFVLFASGLNIASNFILIRNFGVAGAAFGTIFTHTLTTIVCSFKLRKKMNELAPKTKKFSFDGKIALANLRLGLPMAFQMSIIAISILILQSAVNEMGQYNVAYIAAYGAAGKITGLAIDPIISLGLAMTTYTSQNYGAKNEKRVIQGIRHASIIAIIMSLVIGGIVIIFGGHLSGIFLDNSSGESRALAHEFLIINGALYSILGLLIVYRFSLQGLGYTKIPLFTSIIELLIRFLIALVLIPHIRFVGVALGGPLSWLAALIPTYLTYLYAKKKLYKQ